MAEPTDTKDLDEALDNAWRVLGKIRREISEVTGDPLEYAATHIYAQGQQWVPESALLAAQGEMERYADAELAAVTAKLEAQAEVGRLTEALRAVANVLGTGACTQANCKGCHCEMQEAADTAHAALGLKPGESVWPDSTKAG